MVCLPQPENGWGFTNTKTKTMTDKNLARLIDKASNEINYILDVLENKIEIFENRIKELENDLIELEKQHEESLKVAFKKGYDEGYTDHANLVTH